MRVLGGWVGLVLIKLCVLIGQENGKSHLQKTQEEVEEVKVIMLQNMNKAEERSGKLNELEDRADLLLEEVHCPSGKASSLSTALFCLHVPCKSLWLLF